MFFHFLSGLPHVLVNCYRGYRWLWHVLAAVLTAVLVLTGFDWWFFEHTRAGFLEGFIMAAGIGGFFVPVLVPVALYWAGAWRGSEFLTRLSGAVAQAVIVALAISSVYKAFTGRVEPAFLYNSAVDTSREFNFGFLEYGMYWGWPSSHVTIALAGATVLFLALRSPALRTAAVLYALFIATGAAVGFHWFSDVAAGAIVGVLAGTAAYTSMKSVY